MYENHYGERKRLSPYFFSFFLVGVVIGIIFHKELMLEDMIAESNLYYLRHGNLRYNEFFVYIIGKRYFFYAIMLGLLARKSYRPVIMLIFFILGVGSGLLFVGSVYAYGVTGILFFLVMCFPHWFIYGVVITMSCKYMVGDVIDARRYLLRAIVLGILVLAGAIAESYVNPFILSKLLVFF